MVVRGASGWGTVDREWLIIKAFFSSFLPSFLWEKTSCSTGLKPIIQLRLALNSWFPCLHLLSVRLQVCTNECGTGGKWNTTVTLWQFGNVLWCKHHTTRQFYHQYLLKKNEVICLHTLYINVHNHLFIITQTKNSWGPHHVTASSCNRTRLSEENWLK